MPVRPASSIARASAAATPSSSGKPPPYEPSYDPSERTSSTPPTSPSGPPTTRASAMGSPAAAADSADPNTSRAVEPAATGVTMMSMTPPQVSPTAKASSSL